MPASYTPSAPNGVGTDDYRCFLLDPQLAQDAFLTGTIVLPGNADVVHHVILFRVPPDQVDEAEALDAAHRRARAGPASATPASASGPGLDDAPWLGAWAPGRQGVGQAARASASGSTRGTQIVMQVHYNLLAGPGPDISVDPAAAGPGSADLTPLRDRCCCPRRSSCPAARRTPTGRCATATPPWPTSIARFGGGRRHRPTCCTCSAAADPSPGNVQSCTAHDRPSRRRSGRSPATCTCSAARSRSRSTRARPQARTVLDIPVWDFDDQGARPIEPVQLQPVDTVQVTCRHVQWLRDRLPAFEGQPDRYVVWGEGTTDEMCLGILRSPVPDGRSPQTGWAGSAASRSMEHAPAPTERAARPGIHD